MLRTGNLLSMLLAVLVMTFPAFRGECHEIGDSPFVDSFEDTTQTSNNWSSDHLYVFDTGYSGQGIRIENTNSSSGVYISTPLPADLKGYPIYLSAMVSGSAISPKPNHWNGVKCMIVYQTSTGETAYLQPNADVGTFGWTNISCLIYLPPTVTNISLTLGLELVSGTVWFDDVRVKVVGLDNRASLRPNQPMYRGHSLPRLRGAMVPTSLTADSLVDFAGWKGNLIRWQLGGCTYADGLETVGYDSILGSELDYMDSLLPVCQSNNVKVVVDLHSLSQGLLKSAANQTKFKQVWSRIAERYTNSVYRDVIWGYDLANEPNPTEWREGALLWNDLVAQAAQVVRDIDPVMPIIVESHYGSPRTFQFLQPIPVSNVIYSVHMYEPGQYTHQNVLEGLTNAYSYPGVMSNVYWTADSNNWDRAALEHMLGQVTAFASNYSAHIYVGEFSAVRWAAGASNYLDDCISIFEEHGWDWSYHAFREWSGWDTEYGDNPDDFTHPVSSGRQTVLRRWLGRNELDPAGIPLWWKAEYFGSTNAPGSGALDDPDHDGMNNYAEWKAGTCPTNANSRFQVSGFRCQEGTNLVMEWSSVAGRFYAIDGSTNLPGGFPLALNAGIPATPDVNCRTVNVDQARQQFFRVRLEE